MRGWRFDFGTGALAGEVTLDDSDRDPKDPSRFLVPGDVTLIAPPACGDGEIATFRDGAWSIMPRPVAVPTWDDVRRAALARLTVCDRVALRCVKRGVSFPPAWIVFDRALQAIIDAETGDAMAATLPEFPALPRNLE